MTHENDQTKVTSQALAEAQETLSRYTRWKKRLWAVVAVIVVLEVSAFGTFQTVSTITQHQHSTELLNNILGVANFVAGIKDPKSTYSTQQKADEQQFVTSVESCVNAHISRLSEHNHNLPLIALPPSCPSDGL